MPGVVRPILEKVEYSTDYDPALPGGETRVEIPVGQLMQNQSEFPKEESVTEETINGISVSVIKKGTMVLAVSAKDADTFLAGLVAADNERLPVWWFIKPIGNNERVFGGTIGTLGYVDKSALPASGTTVNALLAFGTVGAEAGDTFSVT